METDSQGQLVSSLIELWNAGVRNVGECAPYLDPQIELDSPFASIAGESYRGYAGIARWMRDIDEQFAQWSIVPDQIRHAGNRVVVISRVTARGRGSEVELSFPAAAVCEIGPHERITHFRIYLDVQEALQAVGLE